MGVRGRGEGPAGAVVRYAERGRTRVTRTSGARWSEAAEQTFLDVLAASCNVRMAAEACGFSHGAIYGRKSRDRAFQVRFDAAREQGYARLSMELVRSAADSMEGLEFDADRAIPRMTVDEAIRLWKAHGPQVRGERRRQPNGWPDRRKTLDEVRASILRKIDAIKRASQLGLLDDGESECAPRCTACGQRLPAPATEPGSAGGAD